MQGFGAIHARSATSGSLINTELRTPSLRFIAQRLSTTITPPLTTTLVLSQFQ